MHFDTRPLTRAVPAARIAALRRSGVSTPLPSPVGGGRRLLHVVVSGLVALTALLVFVFALVERAEEGALSTLTAVATSWCTVGAVVVAVIEVMARRARQHARWVRFLHLREFARANSMVFDQRRELSAAVRRLSVEHGDGPTFDRFAREESGWRLETGELLRRSGDARYGGVHRSEYLLVDTGRPLPRAAVQARGAFLPLAHYAESAGRSLGSGTDPSLLLFCSGTPLQVSIARELGSAVIGAVAPRAPYPQIEMFDTVLVVYFTEARSPLSPERWSRCAAILTALEPLLARGWGPGAGEVDGSEPSAPGSARLPIAVPLPTAEPLRTEEPLPTAEPLRTAAPRFRWFPAAVMVLLALLLAAQLAGFLR